MDMMMKINGFRKLLPALLLSLISMKVFPLVPLESLLLGNFEEDYIADVSDPLQYIFKDSERKNALADSGQYYFKPGMRDLGLYRGFLEEGQNLNGICRGPSKISYPSVSERIKAKRVYLAALQYIGLDVVTNYLPLYAKYFEFESDEYENLVDGLIGNSCSQNISVISLKTLKQNMMVKFKTESTLKLPSVAGNPRFPQSLTKVEGSRNANKRAFSVSLDLFKSFCSWGNSTENYRLLVPLLRSPVVGAMIIRELSGQGLDYDLIGDKVLRVEDKATNRFACDSLICRKVNKETFIKKFPRSIGSSGVAKDLERLYCSEFRDADYQTKFQVPQLKKTIKEITFDEQNHLVGQFFSLVTGVPDFILLSSKYSTLQDTFRSSVDKSWDNWAGAQNEKYINALGYEESLTIEAVDPKFYFNRYFPRFSVELDINLGEFDRVNSRLGKLKTTIELKFSKKFLSWARDSWKLLDPSVDKQKVARIKLPFKKMVEDQFKEQLEKFPTLPLKKKVVGVVIRQLIDNLITYEGDFFHKDMKKIIEVPIHLNFAPFALKHLRYRYEIEKNEGRVQSELQRLRSLRF